MLHLRTKVFPGVHSNQDLIWCVKIGLYVVFGVHRGSWLLITYAPPVLFIEAFLTPCQLLQKTSHSFVKPKGCNSTVKAILCSNSTVKAISLSTLGLQSRCVDKTLGNRVRFWFLYGVLWIVIGLSSSPSRFRFRFRFVCTLFAGITTTMTRWPFPKTWEVRWITSSWTLRTWWEAKKSVVVLFRAERVAKFHRRLRDIFGPRPSWMNEAGGDPA